MMGNLLKKYRQPILYIIFGVGTTVVSIGSFVLLHELCKVHELLANIYSWLLAVAFAYFTNRIWVFRSEAKGRALWKEMAAFYSGRLLTLGLEEGFLLVFATWLSFNSTWVKLFAQAGVLIGNYVISKLFIFRQK